MQDWLKQRQRLPRTCPEGSNKGGDRVTHSWPWHCEVSSQPHTLTGLQPPPPTTKELVTQQKGGWLAAEFAWLSKRRK